MIMIMIIIVIVIWGERKIGTKRMGRVAVSR